MLVRFFKLFTSLTIEAVLVSFLRNSVACWVCCLLKNCFFKCPVSFLEYQSLFFLYYFFDSCHRLIFLNPSVHPFFPPLLVK